MATSALDDAAVLPTSVGKPRKRGVLQHAAADPEPVQVEAAVAAGPAAPVAVWAEPPPHKPHTRRMLRVVSGGEYLQPGGGWAKLRVGAVLDPRSYDAAHLASMMTFKIVVEDFTTIA